jgi:hypothetical protein
MRANLRQPLNDLEILGHVLPRDNQAEFQAEIPATIWMRMAPRMNWTGGYGSSALDGRHAERTCLLRVGTLGKLAVCFKHQATVCKYIVPQAHPKKSTRQDEINLDAATRIPGFGERLRMYYGTVENCTSRARGRWQLLV